jgi:hypothetical protein
MKNTHPTSSITNAEFERVLDGLKRMISVSPKTPLTAEGGRRVTPSDLFSSVKIAGHPYRIGCGMASRKRIDPVKSRRVRALLFRARYVLDSRVEATVSQLLDDKEITLNRLLKRQVFGFTKKQGVSFRLSLSTCVPSPLCGGGCYAHDGRERVTSTILSGCYNTIIAMRWEAGEIPDSMLLSHVERAIELAKTDANFAKNEYGIDRRARIRLAHVGELAAYPRFANWLGHNIRELSNGQVDGVVYTRHPNVCKLDGGALIINLTVDESSENRRQWAVDGIRVVWSAWDGKLDPEAEINFLEHHDHGQHALPSGKGTICPVTFTQTEHRFCDAFHCTKCFDNPLVNKAVETAAVYNEPAKSFQTRRLNLLGGNKRRAKQG